MSGRYANAYAGAAQVVEEGEGLVLSSGRTGAAVYPLTHFDRDLFLYYADAEMPTSLGAALRRRAGRQGDALTAELLDRNGLGTLKRRAA